MDHHYPRPVAGARRRTALAGRTLLLTIALVAGAAGSSRVVAQDPLSLADPTLTRALQDVLVRHNPGLKADSLARESAARRARAAGYGPPAVLSAEMDDVPGGFDVADAGFKLEIGREFMTGGRSAAARAMATSDLRVASVRLSGAQQKVRAEALRHLGRIVASAWIARRMAAEDSLLVSIEGTLTDRFSAGEARYVDVLRVRTERLRIQTDRASALAEARASRDVMVGLAGPEGAERAVALVDSAAALSLESATVETTLPPPPSVDSLTALSTDVLLAAAEQDRAVSARESTRAAQRMRLSGSVGLQRRVEAGDNKFGPTLGASVSLPFTRRAANQALLEAAQLDVRAAQEARSAVGTRVAAHLSSLVTHYEAARQRVAVFDQALLQGAREEREGALGAYRAGDLSLIELLDFERSLARAEIERLRALADAAEAYADLIAAASGG